MPALEEFSVTARPLNTDLSHLLGYTACRLECPHCRRDVETRNTPTHNNTTYNICQKKLLIGFKL